MGVVVAVVVGVVGVEEGISKYLFLLIKFMIMLSDIVDVLV